MDPDSDPDPDPAFLSLTFKTPTKKFFCTLLFEGTFTSIFKDKKSKKKSQNSIKQGFSYFFCIMIEGSGSGSRRPKNCESGSGFGSGSATLELTIHWRGEEVPSV
jgi:hypothetical protein